MGGRRDHDARLRRRYGDLTTKSTDLLVNRDGYVLIGDDAGAQRHSTFPRAAARSPWTTDRSPWPSRWGRARPISFADRHYGAPAQHAGQSLDRAEARVRELARSESSRRARAILGAPGKSRPACLARWRGSG